MNTTFNTTTNTTDTTDTADTTDTMSFLLNTRTEAETKEDEVMAKAAAMEAVYVIIKDLDLEHYTPNTQEHQDQDLYDYDVYLEDSEYKKFTTYGDDSIPVTQGADGKGEYIPAY